MLHLSYKDFRHILNAAMDCCSMTSDGRNFHSLIFKEKCMMVGWGPGIDMTKSVFVANSH